MSYFDKYIKYKNKYNSLKQSGGANVNNQRGGEDKYELFVVVNPGRFAQAHLEHFKTFINGSIEKGGVNNLDYYVNYWRFSGDGGQNFYVNLERIKGDVGDKCIDPNNQKCFFLPYMNDDRGKELKVRNKMEVGSAERKEKEEQIMKKHINMISQAKTLTKYSDEAEKISYCALHYNEVTDHKTNQENRVALQKILSHITEKDKVDETYFPIKILFDHAEGNKLVIMVVKINDWNTADKLVDYQANF